MFRNLFSKRHEGMKANIEKVEKELQVQYAVANSLDLVIAMDCTGSMQTWIDQAKASILTIIANVQATHAKASVRVGFVAYRDFCDGAKRLESHELTHEIAHVKHFISTLKAFGGGDGPEDIPGGLVEVLKMDFSAGAKQLIIVAD